MFAISVAETATKQMARTAKTTPRVAIVFLLVPLTPTFGLPVTSKLRKYGEGFCGCLLLALRCGVWAEFES
jgi:hypothetical protein